VIANARRISAVVFYLTLVASLPLISGAPFGILTIYAGCFTLAYLVPALVIANKEGEKIIPWLIGFGLSGVLLFDILCDLVIVKHELGSSIFLFPIALVPLIAIHVYSRKIAYQFVKVK
jgi:hypothetical protein